MSLLNELTLPMASSTYANQVCLWLLAIVSKEKVTAAAAAAASLGPSANEFVSVAFRHRPSHDIDAFHRGKKTE